MLDAVRDHSRGLVVSQVVPNPDNGDNTGSDFVELTHYIGERFRH